MENTIEVTGAGRRQRVEPPPRMNRGPPFFGGWGPTRTAGTRPLADPPNRAASFAIEPAASELVVLAAGEIAPRSQTGARRLAVGVAVARRAELDPPGAPGCTPSVVGCRARRARALPCRALGWGLGTSISPGWAREARSRRGDGRP
jgi:hypothetical protein